MESEKLCSRRLYHNLPLLAEPQRTTYVQSFPEWEHGNCHNYCHLLSMNLPIDQIQFSELLCTHPVRPPTGGTRSCFHGCEFRQKWASQTYCRTYSLMTNHCWPVVISCAHPSQQAPTSPHWDRRPCLERAPHWAHNTQPSQRYSKPQPPIADQEQVPWLIALAQEELRQLPFRELLILLYIFVPQLSYTARHPAEDKAENEDCLTGAEAVKNQYGVKATLKPYAFGPSGMNEYSQEFGEYWLHPVAFVRSNLLPEITKTEKEIRAFTVEHLDHTQHGANKGDAIHFQFDH